ncbi:MAG: hypothetical protein NE330_12155 [Lentisphaeraceae bacterium]|nr:hypothetical protein [Lentisphaeraceae bacterium]
MSQIRSDEEDIALLDKKKKQILFSVSNQLAHVTIKASSAVNRFSLGLLTVTGATIALLVSNMASVIALTGNKDFKVSVFILLLSAFIGALGKLIFVNTEVRNSIVEDSLEFIPKCFEDFNKYLSSINEHRQANNKGIYQGGISEEEFFESITSIYPSPIKKSIKRGIEKQKLNPVKGSKDLMWIGFVHGILITLQFMTLLGAISYLVYNII